MFHLGSPLVENAPNLLNAYLEPASTVTQIDNV